MWVYQATLIRAVDGDTIDCDVDLGFHTTMRLRLRLAGVDTPERGQPGYREATAALEGLLAGRTFTVRTAKTGKYGRWLAYVQTDEVVDVNGWLIEHGYGRPYP